jgi:hypothetical protein
METNGKTKTTGKTGVTIKELALMLKATCGDFHAVAEACGCSYENIKARVQSNRQLRSLWIAERKETIPGGDIITLMKRREDEMVTDLVKVIDKGDGNIEDARRMVAQAIREQESIVQKMLLSNEGLMKAGLSKSSIERLKALGDFDQHTGRMMHASIELGHRTMVDGLLQMFQLCNDMQGQIKADAMREEDTQELLKILRGFMEERRKVYSDLMTGAQILAKISGKGGDTPKKTVKPAYQPLEMAPKGGN